MASVAIIGQSESLQTASIDVTGQTESSKTVSLTITGQAECSWVRGAAADATDLGGSAVGSATSGARTGSGEDSRTGAGSGADSWTGVGSGAYSWTGAGTEQCVAQTHRMATAITGSTEDRETVSVTTSAEALGMSAALAATSGGSTTLETSLKCLWNALVSSNATFTMLGNTGVASVMPEDCRLISITTGGSGMMTIL